MKIKLSYTGYLKFDGVASGSELEVAEGSTVGDLLPGFHVPPEQQRFLKLFANDRQVDPSCPVRDGDELLVVLQVGGG